MISADLLLEAYRQGIFPMGMENGEIGWFSPDPRAIIRMEDFHLPHGLKRTLRNSPFEIRIDSAFERVIRGCANREETWISEEIITSYCEMHRRGLAHSVEAWLGGELAGGLYGVSLGSIFFGESMFHLVTNASKVALWALVERMRQSHFRILEIQWITPHLKVFGATEISRLDYIQLLERCLEESCEFAAE